MDYINDMLDISKKKDLKRAVHFQKKLAFHVLLSGTPVLDTVLGFDASYLEKDGKEYIISTCSLFERKENNFVFWKNFYSIDEVFFPYIPGFFTFREGVGFISCWDKIPLSVRKKVSLIMVDGHGIYHPHRAGLAVYIGIVTQIPTIGCAKQGFLGNYTMPGLKRGDRAPIIFDDEIVGIVLRTRDYVKPMWISPGHLISIDSLSRVVLDLTENYRIPLPIREAHIFSKKLKNML